MIIALYDVEICSCCLLWLANNDRTGCDDTCNPADHPIGLMGHLVLRAGEVCVPGSEPERYPIPVTTPPPIYRGDHEANAEAVAAWLYTLPVGTYGALVRRLSKELPNYRP